MQTEGLEDFRKEVGDWLDENTPKPDFILPDSFMEVGEDQQFEFLQQWQRKVYEAGYLGMCWPKEYGGGGKPAIYQDIADEEMAKRKVPFMVNTLALNWVGPLILKCGTEKQKTSFIKKMLSAEEIWCQGFSEPDNGSDLGNAQLRAVRDGDDYIFNGSKIWTSLATYGKHMILLARTQMDTASKYAGLSFFLAPMDIPGIEISPIRKLTGEFGFAQTFFRDARISAECLMGEEGDGWRMAMTTLAFERKAEGGQAGGQSSIPVEVKDVVELARNTLRDGKPAIEDPLIRDQLVKFLSEERCLGLNQIRAEIPALASDWPASIPMANKLNGSELRRRLTRFAISLQGTNANLYLGDDKAIAGGKWQRAYFNAFSGTIGGGTSEVQRNIIGERILGLPKD